MAKKTRKKSKKKTKSSIKSAGKHSDQGPADDQSSAPVGIRADGMPKFNLSSPTADEIQAAATRLHSEGPKSLAARGLELARKGALEDPQVKSLFGMGSQAPTAHELYGDQGTELSGGSSTEVSGELNDKIQSAIKMKEEELRNYAEAPPQPPSPALQEKILVPGKIEVRSCDWGYGVFAIDQIDDGEIIEEAPVIVLPIRTKDAEESPKISGLFPNVYPIFCNCKDCEDLGRRLVISSGYIQMYNHTEDPNARILQHKASKRIFIIEALKKILPGDQIFLNYGPSYPRKWLGLPEVDSN